MWISGFLLFSGCAANRSALTGRPETPYPPSAPPKASSPPTPTRRTRPGPISATVSSPTRTVARTTDAADAKIERSGWSTSSQLAKPRR